MKTKLLLSLFLTASIIPNLLFSQFTQQGPKLVGTGTVGSPVNQGQSSAISSDGNTAIVGGYGDNINTGAVWIFIRNGSVWSQQGPKLVGTGAIGMSEQGYSVAISSDGNTAIAGAFTDNNFAGAVWVFTRSGGVWTQQGPKLVGSGGIGITEQGASVSVSSDGNTLIEGGYFDNSHIGAAWVFTRSGGVWTQQGTKLVGSGFVAHPDFGLSCSLSSDGNTAVFGGPSDNSDIGAVWIFTRSGGIWTQQGPKLIGTGYGGTTPFEGYSTAISADGNTFAEGGYDDNGGIGAIWIFTLSGGVWSQQGSKLVGTGGLGNPEQGYSVSISSDGNTAVEGGFNDNTNIGAIWVFTRSGGVWTQQGTKLLGTGAVGTTNYQGTSVAVSADGYTIIEGGPGDNSFIGAAWVFLRTETGITPVSNEVPKTFSLSQNYPNPFNPSTVIKFQVASSRFVKLSIYDVLGIEVSSIVNQQLPPGTYEVNFDGTNFPSGVYFCKLVVGDNNTNGDVFTATKKMLLIK